MRNLAVKVWERVCTTTIYVSVNSVYMRDQAVYAWTGKPGEGGGGIYENSLPTIWSIVFFACAIAVPNSQPPSPVSNIVGQVQEQ